MLKFWTREHFIHTLQLLTPRQSLDPPLSAYHTNDSVLGRVFQRTLPPAVLAVATRYTLTLSLCLFLAMQVHPRYRVLDFPRRRRDSTVSSEHIYYKKEVAALLIVPRVLASR